MERMGKITNIDGSEARSQKAVEDMTSDPGLIRLMNCRDGADVHELWLSRGCNADDLQIFLLFQIVTELSDLNSLMKTFFAGISAVKTPH